MKQLNVELEAAALAKKKKSMTKSLTKMKGQHKGEKPEDKLVGVLSLHFLHRFSPFILFSHFVLLIWSVELEFE